MIYFLMRICAIIDGHICDSEVEIKSMYAIANFFGHASPETEKNVSRAARGYCLLSERTEFFFRVMHVRRNLQHH